MSAFICERCGATQDSPDPLCEPHAVSDLSTLRQPDTGNLDEACPLTARWVTWSCAGCGRPGPDPAQLCEPVWKPHWE